MTRSVLLIFTSHRRAVALYLPHADTPAPARHVDVNVHAEVATQSQQIPYSRFAKRLYDIWSQSHTPTAHAFNRLLSEVYLLTSCLRFSNPFPVLLRYCKNEVCQIVVFFCACFYNDHGSVTIDCDLKFHWTVWYYQCHCMNDFNMCITTIYVCHVSRPFYQAYILLYDLRML